MGSMVAAACVFMGIHLFVAGTTLRDRLVERLGERVYMALFSLASIAGITWLAMAYARAPFEPMWHPPLGLRHAAMGLTLLGFCLAVVGLTTPNPTAAGPVDQLLARNDAVRGIVRVTRHPFLWGVALWALAHLLARGDVASWILFGSFGGLALAGTRSIDAKRARRYGPAWEIFAARTSNLPFAAIAQGRTSLALGEIGAWRWLVALGAWAGALAAHRAVFGVSPLPL